MTKCFIFNRNFGAADGVRKLPDSTTVGFAGIFALSIGLKRALSAVFGTRWYTDFLPHGGAL